MEKLELMFKSIDWMFMFIILIGGRYFGPKYFKVAKKEALNFLVFATAFGAMWLGIKYYTVGIPKSEIGNLFITYLFTTSFYEVLAKWIFEWVEKKIGGKKEQTETIIKVEGKINEITETKVEEPKKDN